MRSSQVKDGVIRSTQRSLLKATGLSDEDLKKLLSKFDKSYFTEHRD